MTNHEQEEEKVNIYVDIGEAKVELDLPKRLIDAHGGIDSVKNYIAANMHTLYAELLMPGLRTEFSQMKRYA
jgi:hypothetical protein